MYFCSECQKGIFRLPLAGIYIFKGHLLSSRGKQLQSTVPYPLQLSTTFPNSILPSPYTVSPGSIFMGSYNTNGKILLLTIPVKYALATISWPRQQPLVNEKPLKKSELNINGNLFDIAWLEDIPFNLQILSYSTSSTLLIAPLQTNPLGAHIILSPSLTPRGSKKDMLAQPPSSMGCAFFDYQLYMLKLTPHLPFSSSSLLNSSGATVLKPAVISGKSSSQDKFVSYTCFFQVYFLRCSNRLEQVSSATSIHNQLSTDFLTPFSKTWGRIIIASLTTFPLGLRNRLQMATLSWLVFSQRCEMLLVVRPCKNFLVSGPCTIIILRLFKSAKRGSSNLAVKSLLTKLQNADVFLRMGRIDIQNQLRCTLITVAYIINQGGVF